MSKYADYCKTAILGLKDRSGSSLAAIKKYIATNIPEASSDLAIKNALKAGVTKGIFVQNKASYKVSAEAKKPVKKPAAKKVIKKKPAKKVAKKPAVKKTIKKKPAAKKAKKPAKK